jgi:hypothetical protein
MSNPHQIGEVPQAGTQGGQWWDNAKQGGVLHCGFLLERTPMGAALNNVRKKWPEN